ncbi:MAG: PQQ-binding-like beta-propeller repeat protein, partial [Thermoguttaceae bacterium]|nr:PQQ-binding-like beta-propeller repeat protein [Thermoguttaceae bacterium]
PFLLDDIVWLYCCDLDGNLLWKKHLGMFTSVHGFSCSPLLYCDLVILCQDPDAPTWGYLTALNRRTGDVVWRIRRSQVYGFGTPCLIHSAGKDQLIVNGPDISRSYNPANGAQYWSVNGPTQVNPSCPAWDDDAVYLSGGWPRKSILGVRSDGSGDVSETHVLWKNPREIVPSYVPTLAQKDGILYCLDDAGVFSVIDAKKGTLHWKEKLPEQFYSSPVIVGNRVYLFGRAGTCWIFKAGKQKEKVGENKLGKGVWANPVFLDDGIYLRSLDTLYFIK